MKKISFLILYFFVGILSVSAKEINFYFYPDGGNITTNGFELTSDGYLHYGANYYAKYTSKDTISHINSILGVTFSLTKANTSLVKGREWYFENYNDGKTYFISESKSYKVDDVLKVLINDDDFYAIDLYANWKNKNIKGIDLTSSSSNSTLKIKNNSKFSKLEVYSKIKLEVDNTNGESLTYKSSNSKVARVTPLGRVIGISKGTATITVTSNKGRKDTVKINVVDKAENLVRIKYNVNGGKVVKKSYITTDYHGNVIIDTEIQPLKIPYGSATDIKGLADYNNEKYKYMERSQRIYRYNYSNYKKIF